MTISVPLEGFAATMRKDITGAAVTALEVRSFVAGVGEQPIV